MHVNSLSKREVVKVMRIVRVFYSLLCLYAVSRLALSVWSAGLACAGLARVIRHS